MTRRRKIIIGSAVALAILILLPVRAHYRAKAALAAYKRQLQSQGEKLTIEELIPPAPTNGPNGAFALVGAASRLSQSFNEHSPRAMKYLSPGRAIVGWKQETLPLKNGSTNPWPQLRVEMEANRETMNEIKIALANPVINFNLDYLQGLRLLLPHLSPANQATRCFADATLLELHESHTDAAWENLRAAMATAHCVANEPLTMSQWNRSSMLRTAFRISWEILQFPGWQDKQLVELQTAWQATLRLNSMTDCLALEQADGVDLYELCRQAPGQLRPFKNTPRDEPSNFSLLVNPSPRAGFNDLSETIMDRWIWPLWTSYDEEIWYLHARQVFLTGARLAEKNYALVPALKSINQNLTQLGPAEPRFRIASSLGPSTSTESLITFARTEMMRQLAVTAIAIKRHQLRHGKYPAELSALVPEFLPSVPLDFMDGKPLRYRPLPDGQFLLYSVGEDGEDNGGDATPPDDKPMNKNIWKGRDWVWPLPASPAEIEADNAALRQKKPK